MIAIRDEQGFITYKRESWKEWFRVLVTMGMCAPRFYLPVNREWSANRIIAWIFPLAPFVLLWLIVKNIAWSLWRDLMTFLEATQSNNKLKHDAQVEAEKRNGEV